jgi:hypothetical protein
MTWGSKRRGESYFDFFSHFDHCSDAEQVKGD